MVELRQAIGGWLKGRFGLQQLDPESQVLPVSGTREALFAIAQAAVDSGAARETCSSISRNAGASPMMGCDSGCIGELGHKFVKNAKY